MTRLKLSALALVVVVCAGGHLGAQTSTWRPVVMADHGMVASGHPLASEAGLGVLKSGGNAVDAAIAAWAVQGLVEPMMTGIGGDMFILIYLAKTGEVKFVNGTGPAPAAATIDFYKSKGEIPSDGALSVSVPGAVGAAELAVKKYGSKSLADVLARAVEIADGGFPVTEHLASSLRSSRDKLQKFPSTTRIWFRNGQPLQMGERVVQKEMAETLRRIASGGSAAFYRGEVARATVDYLKANGGLFAESDLSRFEAHEDAPIRVNYRGIDVYECPPNSQGHVMLQALNLLEGFDLRYMGHNSAPYLHLVTESLKLAFADRNRYVGDPRFVPPIPMEALLSKEYASTRRSLIDPRRAIEGEPPAGLVSQPTTSGGALSPSAARAEGESRSERGGGAPRTVRGALSPSAARAQASRGASVGVGPHELREGVLYAPPSSVPDGVSEAPEESYGLTTYLSVVDRDRNMVSITSSLLSGFGSGMVVDRAGYFLNNRMAYFYLDPADVNALVPGKRTRHTINPALALKDGKPFMVFGTPGADTQPQTQLQFFLNVVEFGMNAQQALEAPAVISSSFRSSYYPHEVVGKLQAPASLPAHVREELAALGHKLDVRNVKGVGSVKAILIHPLSRVLMGGVSPTGDSYVMAW